MTRVAVAVMVMVLGGMSGSALAQGAGVEPIEYRFEDEVVRGDDDGPQIEHIRVRPGAASRSLIRVRAHFVGEMLESVENL